MVMENAEAVAAQMAMTATENFMVEALGSVDSECVLMNSVWEQKL